MNDPADALARALQTFHVEAQDMVEQMERCLLDLEQTPDDRELLNALFRSVHTIKGSAGLFGLDALVRFTHQVETVLDRLRGGEIRLDENLGSALLRCADHIADLLAQAREQGDVAADSALHAQSQALTQQLQPWLHAAAGSAGRALVPQAEPAVEAGPGLWHISLRFSADSFRHGIEPLATLRYLARLGELRLVETIDRSLPTLAELDPEQCYLGFEIRLESRVGQAELEDAFEFIRDECAVRMIPPQPDASRYLRLIEELPEDAERLGEILLGCGAISREQLHRALAQQHLEAAEQPQPRPLGSILVDAGALHPQVVDAALQKQSRGRAAQSEQRHFRVPADKLDALLAQVGELVILGAAARTQAQALGASELMETSSQISRMVEDIRNSSLSMRMLAVGESFARFHRVVRDVSASLNKDVALSIEGADTELDKTVIEKIGDPLLHLVRNALDHGLETPDERRAAGKPAQGHLRLVAQHDSGSIVIDVSDDGRGIDPRKVLAKAQERGLVAAGATLSDDEIRMLIFEPGFSTAATVSDLSGRGVGMDVVKRNIEALRGSVSVRSGLGQGTTIRLRLPLTLAIIDGFLVDCADNRFVLPMQQVEECLAAEAGETRSVLDVIRQREHALPVLDLARFFDLAPARSGRRSIVIVRCGDQRAGLVVDRLLGEHQTVVKPLGPLFEGLPCMAGSTILGDGSVGLILDVAALLRMAGEQQAEAVARQTRADRRRTEHAVPSPRPALVSPASFALATGV